MIGRDENIVKCLKECGLSRLVEIRYTYSRERNIRLKILEMLFRLEIGR